MIKKMFCDIHIIDFQSEMASELTAVSDYFFGENYFENHIYSLFKNHQNSVLKIAVTDQNEMAGFGLGFCVNRHELENFLNLQTISKQPLSDVVGILNTIVVKKEFQKKYIAKRLIKNILQYFRSKNIYDGLAIAWKQGDTVYADQLNRSVGFRPIAEQPDFWLKDTLEKKYKCSVCGDVCHCSGVIYYINLWDTKS